MAPVKRRVDDDDIFDAELFDPKYYPKRVYRDGKGPRADRVDRRQARLDAAAPAAV